MIEGLMERVGVAIPVQVGDAPATSALMTSGEFMEKVSLHLAQGEAETALRLARHLLRQLPGHLGAMLAEAQAWSALGEEDLAQAAFEAVLQADPENAEARLALGEVLEEPPAKVADRGRGLREFLEVMDETAGRLAQLEQLWKEGDPVQAAALAQQMPDLPKACLILALLRLQEGRDAEGVALFHDALVREPSLSVARRVLAGHPLECLLLEPLVPWPNEDLASVPLTSGPPRSLQAASNATASLEMRCHPERSQGAKAFGIGVQETEVPVLLSETEPPDRVLTEFQTELERIAGALLEDRAGSFAVTSPPATAFCLLVSSREGLARAYRQEGFEAVDRRLHDLVDAFKAGGQEARVVYVDQAEGLAPFSPVDGRDPHQVKHLLLQIKKAAEEGGRTPRYILLVGGHQVIPPFCLPNPAEDDDEFLLTDNPYGCAEGEVLLPELAVGRLPDAEASRPDILLRLLDRLVEVRRNGALAGAERWRRFLPFVWNGRRGGNGHGPTLGYSASLWREASRAVYGTLADPRHLRMSPPLTYRYVASLAAEPPSIAYFNLHGLAESQCWYGQRDPLFKADYPPFPLALRPADVDGRFADSVVFSAACHGALCWGEQAENRLATRFLLAGCRALVGATATSYGSIVPPVACADLLAEGFLGAVSAGHPVGDALVYAKARLAQQMMERQGYLDGEDQKTLLTFVLYGDPSLPARGVSSPRRPLEFSRPEVVLACDGSCDSEDPAHLVEVAPKLLHEIRQMVRERWPEMHDAAVEVSSRPPCRGSCRGGARVQPKGPEVPAQMLVFRLRKVVPDDGHNHDLQLHITAGADGRVLKMTTCR
ncbi:MAG: C25 family cysteine peptidase [Anaerolineae bacterium]